jgi:hypothetical protein
MITQVEKKKSVKSRNPRLSGGQVSESVIQTKK